MTGAAAVLPEPECGRGRALELNRSPNSRFPRRPRWQAFCHSPRRTGARLTDLAKVGGAEGAGGKGKPSMWNRLNVAGLRQRWASHERDPGRLAPPNSDRHGPGRENGAEGLSSALKQAFLAREAIIDCPQRACTGLLVTGCREFAPVDDASSRVLLRCTRNPGEHEFSFAIETYSADEVGRLKSSQDRGERLLCSRCQTPLTAGPSLGNGQKPARPDRPRAYRCTWCGVSWTPPVERGEQAGQTAGALVGCGSQQGAGRHEG